MKKSFRYSLIGLGFVVFFVLSPLLLLYVTGTKVGFNGEDNSSTGIMDIKSEPSGANVFINNEEENNTPSIVRFLTQGEYEVKITKEGYYDWSKRLPIESSQVTFAQQGVNQVQLIKKSDPVTLDTGEISGGLLIGNTLWYGKDNDVVYISLNDPNTKTIIPDIYNQPTSLTLLRDKKHLMIINGGNGFALINIDSKAVSNVPVPMSESTHIEMPSNDVVLYSDGNKIYSYNLISKNTVELKAGVRTFTLLDNTAYFVRADGKITSAVLNGNNFIDEQTIAEGVVINESGVELLITDRKELFVNNTQGGFYRVGTNLEKIAERIDGRPKLDINTNDVTYQISGEYWFYNFLTNKPQLLTRDTNPSWNDFFVRSSIGYGFMGNAKGLEAIEIDTRDKQNRYQLLTKKSEVTIPTRIIAISDNQKTVIAIHDGLLVSINIRD